MPGRRGGRTRAIVGSLMAVTALNACVGSAVAASAPHAFRYIPVRPNPAPGTPNVLLIMTDDVGFSASSTFGGAIPTPTFDALARHGLRYTQFHTTAMCSPTRAALLTGRNHHSVGMGSLADLAFDEPGYTAVIPDSAATIGRVLRDQGFDTAFFGKNHNTPNWELGPLGPFNHQPNGLGFNYFYGFNAAATDQINPDLTENLNPVRRDPKDPDYFLDHDLADHMIKWLRMQHTLQPDRPFFAYLATGTMHMPQQAPAAWIDRFKGQFDEGWDVLRAQVLERQKKLGIVPADTKLAPLPPGLPAWSSLSPAQKHIYARMMEVAAATLAYADNQIGRVIAQLKEAGELDNTLIIFIQGDNGASMERKIGTVNELLAFHDIKETDADLAAKLPLHGGEHTEGQYHAAWASAMNAPLPWGKQIASHLGGLRDGMVMSWPRRIKDMGGIRTQFSHVIDIAPTIYEAVGIKPPTAVDGVKQQPIDGTSMVYTWNNASAPSRHREQYFEMMGNRAYYKDGWIASTTPGAPPWENNTTDPLKAHWELYDLSHDWSQTNNLAARYPQKLHELQHDFDAAAKRYHVYPLTADFYGRLAGGDRPTAMTPGKDYLYYSGDIRYTAATWPAVNAKWVLDANIVTASPDADGPIVSVGNALSGYTLSLIGGRPVFDYHPTGRTQETRVLRGLEQLAPGPHAIIVSFTAQDSKTPRLELSVDGTSVALSDPTVAMNASGPAYVGRPALDDRTGPRACGCDIKSGKISYK